MSTKLIIIALAGLWISPCLARTIIVDDNGPADFNNIQAAINDANNGDTVIVQPGTYTGTGNRDIDFMGKAVAVRGTMPADPCIVAATIIDCENSGRGFYFHSDEDGNSVLEGLTITHGNAANGGAISCNSASPAIKNCVITDNKSQDGVGGPIGGDGYHGGGIFCVFSSAKIENCTITYNISGNGGNGYSYYEEGVGIFPGNSGSGGCGGGLYLAQSPVMITGCEIAYNKTGNGGDYEDFYSVGGQAGNGGNGGGIYGSDSSTSVTLKDCRIIGNTAGNGGEGYYAPGGNGGWGGGISFWWSSTFEISGSDISNNSSGEPSVSLGGGICCYDASAVINNCKITHNNSIGYGAGISSYGIYSEITISNCTISGNGTGAEGAGSGISNNLATATIANSIVWGNSSIQGDISNTAGSINISYSDVNGDWAETGNINADPCFVDPCNGDYHLQSAAGRWNPNTRMWIKDANTSVCIDAGDPNSDWTKELWPNGKRINMGAYGGTPEAGMSLSAAGNIANLDNDPCDTIDLNDLAEFVNKWCYEEYLLAEDLDRNGHVDFNDFAIFARQYDQTQTEFNFSYNIGSCTEGMSQNTPLYQTEETRFTVTVEGRRIHFEDMMVANCCAQYLWLEMVVIDNLIIIYEHEYALYPCYCICNYPVDAQLGPFEEGTYTVEVYEDFGGFIGSATVTIN